MKLSKYNLLVPTFHGEECILFNTFNGSCLKVEKDVVLALENQDISLMKTEKK